MAEKSVEHVEQAADEPVEVKRKRRWAKRAGWLLAIILAPIFLAMVFFNSPIGKRFVADQIAQTAPASGLKISIGRIEGDLYGEATLHDVALSDPKGVFLTVPLVELDWRPLAWLRSGLDVRTLIARRGTLLRLPELLPGDPDAPILPDFDIRVDEFAIDNLTVSPGIAGDEAHRVDLTAQADIRSGHVYLSANGKMGDRDNLALLLDAEPDGDTFDISLDYQAPEGGMIAQMIGAQAGYRARIDGDGTWSDWLGNVLVQRDEERFAAFQLTNKAGEYALLGQVRPAAATSGIVRDALGQVVSVSVKGTLVDSVWNGRMDMVARAITGRAEGAVDLAGNSFDDFNLAARLRDPNVLGEGLTLSGTRLLAKLDGPFQDLAIEHTLTLDELVAGTTVIEQLGQQGVATFDGADWTIPLSVGAERVVTGSDLIDSRLTAGRLTGNLTYGGTRLFSDDLRLDFDGLSARMGLRGDVDQGNYRLTGPVEAQALQIDDLGNVDGTARVDLAFGSGGGWRLQADVAGQMDAVSNATVANLAGDPVAFTGALAMGSGAPLSFDRLTVDSERLQVTLDGKVDNGRTSLAGSGTHTQYGPFTVDAAIDDTGPNASLVFASPLPAAGLSDVRVAIAPADNGLRIETEGGSTLGPFSGVFGLVMPEDGPSQLAIEQLRVWRTQVSGDVVLVDSGARGDLTLSGGGIDGTIALTPRDGGQSFAVNLTADDARFGGETPIALSRANIVANGFLIESNSEVDADITAQGVSYGSLFLGRVAATARVENGRGDVTARLAGRRGSQFSLQLDADITPDEVGLLARGRFAGRAITMPQRAVLSRQSDGGWQLARSQIGYGGGFALVEGEFGGTDTGLDLKLDRMPLSLTTIVAPDLGIAGTISGLVEYSATEGSAPTGSAKVKIDQLTRSGLVLSSRPLDVVLIAELKPDRVAAHAVLNEDGKRLGRVQARVTKMPSAGSLFERLQAGKLLGQMRYDGQADALWRLATIEVFDLTGPVALAADVTGTLADPRVRGTISSDDLRVQSSLSGTDISDVKARGSFNGSRLSITRFSGKAPNGGTIAGSGTIDLTDISATRGPQIDLRAATDNARLLNANGLVATVTGPLRIISNGNGGTIAGRLEIDRASWVLGAAEEDVRLPNIATREINLPTDIEPPSAPGAAWRYLIDARARSRIDVDGMGLDSEWRADIRLRGTTEDPRLGGEARVVRGYYSFAGTRFELSRGEIEFDEFAPIDPRVNIAAITKKDGLDVTVNVTGNALKPEVTFSSDPGLPEEEILSHLLFGGSITSLSATDALQLGTALASLRGGSGIDPINQLRSAIGLDRLRIVGADPALDRGTGVAVGKNIGRKFYVEIITDGRGYSATSVEFRITSWLALLASVSTIGRENALIEVSRDY
ncbi:MAG: translocation/assembly module TamB domain-containing protein [Erythrobacter sp.]